MTQPSDQNRFTALLEEHRGQVRRVVLTYGATPEDREDLAQEILAALWQSFASYDPGRPFGTWLYRVALNVAISHLRTIQRRRRVVRPGTENPDPPDPRSVVSEGDDRVADLQSRIAGLDEFDRALLMLHLDAHSYAEIAEVLGISPTNVGTKLHRLRRRLAQPLPQDQIG